MDQRASVEIDPDQELGGRIGLMYTLFDLDRAVDYVKVYVVANPHHHFVEAAGTVWWWRELRNHPRWSEIAALGGG
jgi:hypothetical protein